ncbi:hypothetical protein Ae201684_005744 [Aphanomyces euteiches]|uniref:DNA 5'-3' helicase FANCJ n=1 Tax=Aphanomyces euteiches TaxID=100861 RepID=A0A6G0XE08_9STRA|nr:hypothetical protein Ae201684_005744 [Aphanomyces euteiches]KAH9154142.1 hypothetical protein AeRB84_003720 [Aphanomyces euteiches]
MEVKYEEKPGFMIMGYKVEFPEGKKPFPAQFAVMNKVLIAMKKQQNALLESPTGSGKTLALLCASMAWHQQHSNELMEAHQVQINDYITKKLEYEAKRAAARDNGQTFEQFKYSPHDNMQQTIDSRENPQSSASSAPVVVDFSGDSEKKDPTIAIDKSDNDDDELESISFSQIQRPKKRPLYGAVLPHDSPVKQLIPTPSLVSNVAKTPDIPPPEMEEAPKRERTPQIYFCSRTHSQLSQVIQELKKCQFASRIKMTLLGAKKHYCIHPSVRKEEAGALNDACSDLLDARNCRFQTKGNQRNELRNYTPSVWDIEDLVELGETHRECPYFFARGQQESAEIIFCPYNYIIHPEIRSSCAINLKNAVVIFDEAHNIEDVCRDAASLELSFDTLDECLKIINAALQRSKEPSYKQNLSILRKLVQGWFQWLSNSESMLKPMGYEYETRQWNGTDAIVVLAEYCSLTPTTLADFKMAYEMIATDERGDGDDELAVERELGQKIKVGNAVMSVVSGIMSVAVYLFRDNLKYVNDFKLAAVKQRGFGKKSNEWVYKACIWCLYAGVAFSDITSNTRSVILTSGTLSPMTTFAGELGTTFPITLEANHVVNMQKQVWFGSVVRGPPKHRDFSATYANQQALNYQDSLGELALNACQIVPGGVLIFVPSYRFLTLLHDRWRATGLLSQIEETKTIFVEPRAAGKDFDALLDDFKTCIQESRAPGASKTGAFFFAVFRGKVSEGIDFSNDNARAVICVGIPFPNIKEQQIALKQAYQNERAQYDKTCAPGRVWYEHQAFRALNQALGRCIRHRLDYGAILLVDSRYQGDRYTHQLSKWTRGHCQEFEKTEEALESVRDFFTRVAADPTLQYTPEPVAPKTTKKASVKDKPSAWRTKKPKTMHSFFPYAN